MNQVGASIDAHVGINEAFRVERTPVHPLRMTGVSRAVRGYQCHNELLNES